jgi:metal-responsive CopG/Arc/MetJ family transcriptional regulator
MDEVHVMLPRPVVREIDALAKRQFTTRSTVIRAVLLARFRSRLSEDDYEAAIGNPLKP